MKAVPQIAPTKAAIETCTACNHRCVYCPVSKFPVAMDQMEGLGNPMTRISFNHYNEPLLGPLLVDRARIANEYSFFSKILINTNLSLLRGDLPKKLKFIRERMEFNVNLPTIDRDRYRNLHGADHYPSVEKNIDRLIEAGFRVRINVQSSNLTKSEDVEGVVSRFGKRASVEVISSNSRAGLVKETLVGCSINRPTGYLHIGVHGEVFLCCQDFFKFYRLGHLRDTPLAEILRSETATEYLGYLYGQKEAPASFICRNCNCALFRSKER